MLVSRQAVEEFRSRKLNDYVWMKQLSKADLLSEILQLVPTPQFKTDSWLHQLVCFYIAMTEPKFLFLLDMGAGKTKLIADIITQRKAQGKLKRALVFVPRSINFESWAEALRKHSDLTYTLANVPNIQEKWRLLSNPTTDITIIDYQGMHLACTNTVSRGRKKPAMCRDDAKIKQLKKIYNFVCLDESHFLKGNDNLWFSILSPLTKDLDYCYAMTGTLFGKVVEDLWSQFFLVDRGETFGVNLSLFRAAFFNEKFDPWKGTVYTYNQRMDGELHRMLQHKSIRYDESELDKLPERVMVTRRLVMTDEQREHYTRALEGLINADGKLMQLDGNWLRMRQIASGYQAWTDDHGAHVVRLDVNPKLQDLLVLLSSLLMDKLIVCYDYTETGRLITEKLAEVGIDYEWYYGGTKDKSACRARFMKDARCRVFVMNSSAGGVGNDGLQDVCSHMYFFEIPTPPIVRMQTIKRVSRPGQKSRTYIYDPVMRNSCDVAILESLAEGIDIHSSVINGSVAKKLLSKNK